MLKMVCVWLSPIYSSLILRYTLKLNSYHQCETVVSLRSVPSVSGGVSTGKVWMTASCGIKLKSFQIYPLAFWGDSFVMLAQSLVSSKRRTCQSRESCEHLSTFEHWLPFSSKLQASPSFDFVSQADYLCSQMNLWNADCDIITLIIWCY